VELYTVPESSDQPQASKDKNPVTLATGLSSIHAFSPNGKKLIVHLRSAGVRLFDLPNLGNDGDSNSILLENTQGVQFMVFSSKGSYILTWERAIKPPQDDANSSPPPNLKIWSSTTGQFLHGFQMRGCRRSQWPPIRWTHDERHAFHLVTNEIHIYDGHVFADHETENKYVDRIRCKGASTFSLPPTFYASSPGQEDKYVLSTFVPETKGKPARISLLRYPDKLGNGENPKSGQGLVSKSFYQAEECSVDWSPKGDSALILTQNSVDTSGASYYGSTNLYLLLSESKSSLTGEALSVPLPGSPSESGPVLDVAWMPNASKLAAFCVISGKMPAMASLHNGSTAEPTFLFGNAHRNTIVWSDHGRFVTLGGFGNLAGGMDFYDKNKLKPIPQFDPVTGADLGSTGNKASCAVGYGWSPSSRYFMVSTTTPRMNVDNGVRLYKYNGLEVRDESIVTWDNAKFGPGLLLAAEFVPASSEVYPDRAQSPPPKRSEGEAPAVADGGGGAVVAPPSAYVPPPGRYVPPGARKSGSGMSLADKMRKEREGNAVGATKLFKGAIAKMSSTGKKLPVGMAPDNEGKSKSALRKERQRLAKEKMELAEREEKERKEREEKERIAAAAGDPVKRSKKLNKTLKQIKDLKAKDPSTLNDDQKNKIAMEEGILKELAELKVS